jgi:hypothetical protein
MTRRLLLTAAAPLILVLSFAAPARATPPTSEMVQADPTPYYSDELCGADQRVWFVDSGSFKLTVFYDDAGNPVKALSTNYRDRYTVTASANGRTLTTNAPAVVIEDLTAGTELVLGLHNAYHVPGAGVVLLDAGRILIDLQTFEPLFAAGPHEYFSAEFLSGNADAFCNYFFGA